MVWSGRSPPSCKRREPVTAQCTFWKENTASFDSKEIRNHGSWAWNRISWWEGTSRPHRPEVLSAFEVHPLLGALPDYRCWCLPCWALEGLTSPSAHGWDRLTPLGKYFLKTLVSKRDSLHTRTELRCACISTQGFWSTCTDTSFGAHSI